MECGPAVVSAPLGRHSSGLVCSSFSSISAFLDLANPNCLLPPLLCCAVLSCSALGTCSQPVQAPTCSLIVCFIDVCVRAVLAAKLSHVKELWMLGELCLLLCHTTAATLGWKRMALHGMLQLSPELVTHAAIELRWICDSSFAGARFHGPGAVSSCSCLTLCSEHL